MPFDKNIHREAEHDWWMKEVRMFSRKWGQVEWRLSYNLFLGQQYIFTKQIRAEHHRPIAGLLGTESAPDYW